MYFSNKKKENIEKLVLYKLKSNIGLSVILKIEILYIYIYIYSFIKLWVKTNIGMFNGQIQIF